MANRILRDAQGTARGVKGRTAAAEIVAIAAIGMLAAATVVQAAEIAAPPQDVVRLSSSASVDVTKDLLSVTFSTQREGADAAAVQSQLKQAVDAALSQAKGVARAGQLDVRTGSFSLAPRYTPKGVANGWQGSAELIVEGRDMQAIGQLSGRITTLTISRVGYDLSRDLRESSEADVASRAIANYRAKAGSYAKQFGYASYAIREVEVSTSEAMIARPMMALRMKESMAAPSDEALPVEAGKASVTVNVHGTVQLIR